MASTDEERLRLLAEAWARTKWPNARIVHELVLNKGTSRLDVAVVGAAALRLIEIKSARDVLDRLAAQIATAADVAQEVWVVCDPAHLDEVLALSWSVGVLVEQDGQLVQKREAYVRADEDARALMWLLWTSEIQHFFGTRLPGSRAHPFIVDRYGRAEIREKVCRALRGRPFPRGDAPCEPHPGAPASATWGGAPDTTALPLLVDRGEP